MKSVRLVFLGGIFPPDQESFIASNSRGVVQNAADALQKKLLLGFDKILCEGVDIVNLPFVGSYPRRFKSIYFSGVKSSFGSRSRLVGVGFFNIAAAKFFFRFIGALWGLFVSTPRENSVVLVYSAHMPFVLASFVYRFFSRRTKVCLIVPDLPEFMGDGGIIYSVLKSVESWFFYRLARRSDYFVALTEYMIDRIGVDRKKAVVVEGVASVDEVDFHAMDLHKAAKPVKSLLYTGTLARRYGVLDLVEAFRRCNHDDVELWVCGDGDGREEVVKAAAADQRIKYLGQVSRLEAMKLQFSASILINPRAPEGEFTRYSFPSKIMEYMVTGRPIVMYKLPGMSEDYNGLYFSPDQAGVEGLFRCLVHVLGLSADELESVGKKAKNFVLSYKNPVFQAQKILDLIQESK